MNTYYMMLRSHMRACMYVQVHAFVHLLCIDAADADLTGTETARGIDLL